MRKIVFILSLLICQPLLAQSSDQVVGRSITVQATAYVEAVPDTLLLNLSVKRTSASLREARVAADAIVEEVVSIAISNGIAEHDIDSSRLSSWPEYQWRQDKRHYMGEAVQRDISIKVRNLDGYGGLIGQLSELPLHRIQNPQLSHSDIDELQLQALRAALARGKVKAGVIAAEIEATLGVAVAVQELTGATPPMPRMMMAEAASSAGNNEPTFSLSKQRISARVEMTFSLVE
jgi:uncharacterized protein YggE